MFKIDHRFLDHTKPKEWVFSGKVRVHSLPITGVTFGESINDKDEIVLKLFTIGLDKKLVEYDVPNSNIEKLKIIKIYEIEQEFSPTACIWNP